jgi:4-amino-4-deoxy-L-arabinose transferase-like glycosyltransferase
VSAGVTGRRRRVGLAGVLLIAILVLALALRLKGVAYGLPYSLVNSDESMVVPKAFHAAQGHLDPRFFFYPSLYFYLTGALYLLGAPVWWLLGHGNFLSQDSFVVDPGPYFLLGRLLSVAMGTVSVYLVYRLGRDGFGRAAGLLAALFLAVVPLHVAYSHMAVTDVTAVAFSLLAFVLLQLAVRDGHRAAAGSGGGVSGVRFAQVTPDRREAAAVGLAAERRAARLLAAGAVAAGLATSTKYNLGMLVLPATVAAVLSCRPEVARRAAAGSRAALVWLRVLVLRVYVPMAVAFVVASPFVVLDAPRFLRDFRRQNQIMDRGWLGFEHAGNGFWYNVTPNLTGAIGVVLVVLAVAGVAWALWRRTRLDLLLAPYVVVYFLYIGTWKELADRYLLPIVPLLLLLAVRLCVELALRWPRARRFAVPAVVVVLAVAFVAPLAASVAFDRELSGRDTREIAREWIQHHVAAGSLIAVENYGPPLVREDELGHYRAGGLDPVAYRILRLQLPAPGTPDRTRDIGVLRRQGVQYVVVSSRVYDRVRAAPEEYPTAVAFYDQLGEKAQLVKEFRPGAGERGPVLKLYRLDAGG